MYQLLFEEGLFYEVKSDVYKGFQMESPSNSIS